MERQVVQCMKIEGASGVGWGGGDMRGEQRKRGREDVLEDAEEESQGTVENEDSAAVQEEKKEIKLWKCYKLVDDRTHS